MDGRSLTSAVNGKAGGRPQRISDATLETARALLLRAANEDDLAGDTRNELATLAVDLERLVRRR